MVQAPPGGTPSYTVWIYTFERPYSGVDLFPPGWVRYPTPYGPVPEYWAFQVLGSTRCTGHPCQARVSFVAPYSGSFFVTISPGLRPIDLIVDVSVFLSGDGSVDFNDHIDDAQGLYHAPQVDGSLTYGLDSMDWFWLPLAAGDTGFLRLEVNDTARVPGGDLVNKYELTILTPDGTRAIAVADTPQPGSNASTIALYLPSAIVATTGDYLIRVSIVSAGGLSQSVCVDGNCTAGENSTASGTATYSLYVVQPNAPPQVTGSGGTLAGTEDLPLVVETAPLFTDPEGDPLTYSVFDLPPGASVSIDGSNVTLFPPPDFFGNLTFTLRATDWFNASTDLVLTAYFAPVPDAPRVNASTVPTQVSWDQLNGSGPLDYSPFLFDPDGDLLAITLSAGPPVRLSPCGDTCIVLEGATDDDFGDFLVTLTATDPTGRNVTFALNVSIRHVNRGPWPAPDAPSTVVVIATSPGTTLYAAAACFDPDDDPSSITRLSSTLPPGALVATPTANGSGADLLLRVPDEDHTGTWSGTFACSDALEQGPPFDLELVVVPPNHAPAVVSVSPLPTMAVSASENSTVPFSAAFTDEDPASLSFAWFLDDAPVEGASGNATGVYFGFEAAGTRTVSLVVTDREGLTTTVEWTVSVANVDRPPVCGIVAHGNLTAPVGTNVSFSSSAFDPDGDPLFFLWTANGSLLSRDADAVAAVAAGTNVVALRVSAGPSSTQCSVTLVSEGTVAPPGGEEPASPAGGIDLVTVGLLGALGAAALGLMAVLRRRAS